MSDVVLTDVPERGVLRLTLNRPDALNALNRELLDSVTEEVQRFASAPDLKALVITGAGRAFSSGLDVRSFQRESSSVPADTEPPAEPAVSPRPWDDLDPAYTDELAGRFSYGPDIVRLLYTLDKPSFAAVNGHAYGLGCGIALTCDFRVAARSARFNDGFIRNGLVSADGSTWQLSRLIGSSNSLWMQYSGATVDGAEAYRIGLANWLVEDDDLLDQAIEKAAQLARGPVYAMGLIKQLTHRAATQSFFEHLGLASRAQGLARKTEDHREGVRAFIEKRQPEFKGY